MIDPDGVRFCCRSSARNNEVRSDADFGFLRRAVARGSVEDVPRSVMNTVERLDESVSGKKNPAPLFKLLISASNVARCSLGPFSLDFIFSSSIFFAAIFFFNLGLLSCACAEGELEWLPDRYRERAY